MGNSQQYIDDGTVLQSSIPSRYILRSLDEGIEYPLSAREILVGREVECQIPLRAGHVSRYHAKITITADSAYIEDLESTNGTFINGKRVIGRQAIGIGDDIRFHEQHFRLTSAESGSAEETLVTQPAAPPARDPDQSALYHSETIEAAAVPASVLAPPPRKTGPIAKPRPHTSPTPGQGNYDDGDDTSILGSNTLQSLAAKSSDPKHEVKIGHGPRLVILTAPIRGKVFPLPIDAAIGRRWDIGRGQDATITLADKTISNHHARIVNTQNGWLITTVHASNGILVNGLSITRAFLAHNDRIRLGRIELAFMTNEGEPPAESIYDIPVEKGYNKGFIATVGISALALLTILIALAIH